MSTVNLQMVGRIKRAPFLPPAIVIPATIKPRKRKRNRAGLTPIPWGKPDPKLAAALRDDWIGRVAGRESMRHVFAWAIGLTCAVLLILATVAAVLPVVPHG